MRLSSHRAQDSLWFLLLLQEKSDREGDRLIACSFGEEEEGALIGRARAARSLLLALLVCGFSGFRLFPARL